MLPRTRAAAQRLAKAYESLEPKEAALLKALKLESGKEISEIADMSQAFVSDIRHGRRKLTPKFVKRLAEN